MTHTTKPFAELVARGDYELTVFVTLDLEDYADPSWPMVAGHYAIEAGCEGGKWRLRTSPVIDENDETGAVLGPPLIDLRDQDRQPDPLACLLWLLRGRVE